jgi:Flp pilus assembly protein TadD
MLLRPLVLAFLFVGGALGAALPEDPFAIPQEVRVYAHNATANQLLTQGKLQGLLSSIFRPVADGGLGIVYDNEHTRTVAEVWRDRKANCLSITAFYVAACRSVGIEAKYAEALNTNRWRKVGNVVRFERHVVALSHTFPKDDLIADFIPTLRRRSGIYVVAVLEEARFRALFHSNRAVELLSESNLAAAKVEAQASLDIDPKGSVGWNIMGVVLAAGGELIRAEQSYRMALTLDGRDSAAIGNMEMLLRNSGRAEEAKAYRILGEDVRKKDPYFNAYLAEEALQEGDFPEAQSRIRVALKILPHESEFYLTQAKIKLMQGKTDDAVKDLQDAKRWAEPGERERYDSKLAIIQGKGEEKK